MPRLPEKEYTYFRTVRGMCRTCREIVPARVFFREGKVWQESLCAKCSNTPVLIASDENWYLDHVLKPMPDRSPVRGAHPPRHGCPHDCGPCTWHASACQLPVVSITNACNLRCPICFTYNRDDVIYHMPVPEMQRTVAWIVESAGSVDLINVTGGEPTLHPHLLDILNVCKRPEIGRVTMNSNGLRLAEDYELCERLAEMGIYVILSFNTFDGDVCRQLHGRDITEVKLRALDNLARAGVKVTLLHVMIHGVNEDAVTGILELMQAQDNILSLTVQTMTYTGQGGGRFERSRHIPVDLAVRHVCAGSKGLLERSDFVSRPSAHPLCYQICYLLKNGGDLLPMTRFMSREQIEQLMRDSYLIRPEQGEEVFKDAINQLYAEDRTEPLAVLRTLIDEMYPSGTCVSEFQRQRIAESAVRTVYVHAHMDEDTFDCSRAMQCPDLVPAEPGRLIPACTYNLFYRRKDDRFYAE